MLTVNELTHSAERVRTIFDLCNKAASPSHPLRDRVRQPTILYGAT